MSKPPLPDLSLLPVLGVDVAKLTLDVCGRSPQGRLLRTQVPNSPAGFQALWRWLAAHQLSGQVLVAMEATGHYGMPLAEAAHAAGHLVAIFNSCRVLRFCQSAGRKNKTDRVDAELIASYARALREDDRLRYWQPLPAAQLSLRELVRRQHDLETQRQAEARRLEAAPTGPARLSLQRSLRWLAQELARVQTTINAWLKAHAQLATDVARLQAIPGIGRKTAIFLVAEIPRYLRNARAAAAWLGLTPRQSQSGTSVQQPGHLGKDAPAVRAALYMPAMAALRCNERCRALAARLRSRGKAGRSVLGAIMHQLLRCIFHLLKHQVDYDPTHRCTQFTPPLPVAT